MIDVRLSAFEGPLDLLLTLIQKNKVDIYDIPIAEITDQYVAYVEAMKEQDLDTLCDFLLLAATLLDIKARMLLPKEQNEDGEEEDPRSELVERLIEYQEFKMMSGKLRDYYEENEGQLFKDPTIPDEVREYEVKPDISELMKDVTMDRLREVFRMVSLREEERIDPLRSGFGQIEKDPVRLSEKLVSVLEYGQAKKKLNFREFLHTQKTKADTVVAFLACLELIRIGRFFVRQDSPSSEIELIWNEDCDTEITKEDMEQYD